MCAPNGLSLLNASCGAQKHTSYVVFLQVHHDSHGSVLKFEQLVGLSVVQPVDTGHSVAYRQYCTNFIELLAADNLVKLPEKNLRYLTWFYFI